MGRLVAMERRYMLFMQNRAEKRQEAGEKSVLGNMEQIVVVLVAFKKVRVISTAVQVESPISSYLCLLVKSKYSI